MPSLEAAASTEELPDQQPASKEEPSGRFDGSEASLASGFGNQPLSLKLVLAEGCRTSSFDAWTGSFQKRSFAAFPLQLCSLMPEQLGRRGFADSLASFSPACLMVSFGEAASKRSFQLAASNLAAYRLQLSMCRGSLVEQLS